MLIEDALCSKRRTIYQIVRSIKTGAIRSMIGVSTMQSNRMLRYWIAFYLRYYVLGLPGVVIDWTVRRFVPSQFIMGIRVIDPVAETRSHFTTTVERALTMMASSDARRFKRVQREICTILNQPVVFAAQYFRPLKTCALDLRCFYDEDPDTTARLFASALVHEATHGSLFSARVAQTRYNHSRVERLCCKEAERFLARVGMKDPPWDFANNDIKPTPLSFRLRWMREEIRELAKRDYATDAKVWEKVASRNRGQSPENGEAPQ